MIKIICHSNLDNVNRFEWPIQLPTAPRVDDLIRSPSSKNNCYLELAVVRCIWVKASHIMCSNYIAQNEWYLDVELHLPKHRWENISQFDKWLYKNFGML